MNKSTAPRRSYFKHLLLTAVLGIALVGLSQCRSVSETVTGVDLRASTGSLSVRSSCQRRCNQQFKAGLIAEELRHHAAKRACHYDYACKKNEDRLHAANLRELQQRKTRCKRSCYNEGAGQGA